MQSAESAGLCPALARKIGLAQRREADMDFISSHGTKAAGLPFSDAVKVGDILYLSGQIGNLPGKMELAPGGMEGQTRQMMENIARVLNANGLSFDDVFKCLVMMKDMNEWGAFNSVYVEYFKPERLPSDR